MGVPGILAGMSRETVGGAEVLAALEHTIGRGSARIEFCQEFSLDLDMGKSRSDPAEGGSGSPLRRLIRRLGSDLLHLSIVGALRLLGRWLRKQGPRHATGVIDFRAHQCRYHYPSDSRTVLVKGDLRSEGARGAKLSPGSPGSVSALEPLWLFDLIRGVVDAQEQTAENLDGQTCRRFAAHADLNRVAEAVPHHVALPTGMDRLDDLKQVPVDVWLDQDGHIRRIRHDMSASETSIGAVTLDLSDFGVEPPSDWFAPSLRTDAV